MSKEYEAIIGLEVHVELSTQTKIFCGCAVTFGAPANTHICPVCTGMPGALPVLNKQAVSYAMAAGLALNCKINQNSSFDRKNYFYPDKPQNYQITQLYHPICYDGYLDVETKTGKCKVDIREIHMEEDAGKLLHDLKEGYSAVDFNRSGVPLIEIVTNPDLRSAEEVTAFLEQLCLIMRYLGVSDCKLQEGSMRADVNLSLREKGTSRLGTRTEMKNLNSFRGIARAIAAEQERQAAVLSQGGEVEQETRRWDDDKGCSFVMRSKEDAQDYRYFPEPDLLPVTVSDDWLQEIKDSQPEFRESKRERLIQQYGISSYEAGVLTESRQLADLFEAVAELCKKPKKAANWLLGETLRLLRERGLEPEDIHFSAANLAKLIERIDEGGVSSTAAKEVFGQIFDTDVDPDLYIQEKGLKMIGDEEVLRNVIQKVLDENPKSVADYRGGKEKAIGFLVGRTMAAMAGKADPSAVNRILKGLL